MLVSHFVKLSAQTPGVASKLKAFKRSSEHGASSTRRVEPIDSPATDRAITQPAEALNQIASFETKALLIPSRGSGESHAEQFARLGIEPWLAATNHPWSEPHPKGSVAATLPTVPVAGNTLEFVVDAGLKVGMAINIPLLVHY